MGLLTGDLVRRFVDSLCIRLSMTPLEFGGSRILLAVDAGYGLPLSRLARGAGQAMESQARQGLVRSSLNALPSVQGCSIDRERYREDMKNAADLLGMIGRGQGLFKWRPVRTACSEDTILHYEAVLKLIDEKGESIDGREGREALERLGLSYLHDRQMICHVLDELEADPNATLSLQISSTSLSFDLNGASVAWTDVMLRLRQQPGLASRLIVEIAEPTPDRILPAAKVFINSLRATGVRVAIAGFGSDFSSIRQILTFQPDIIKLSGAFLRGARDHTIHLRHIVALAGTLADTVIVDGVEGREDEQVAHREGAEWMVGSELRGLPCEIRSTLCGAYAPYTEDSEILRYLHNTTNYYHAPAREWVSR
jgi:EAL domain-containing protein (putative c-di-GMP-specific phosphodiesterase class I)